MTDETKHKLQTQLASEIEFKIKLLEKRAAIHAQTMYPIKNLELKSPDYGLGIIPKLMAITNSNDESERVIEECHRNKKKLLFIKKNLNAGDLNKILKCLSANEYARMMMAELEVFLGVETIKKKCIGGIWRYLVNFKMSIDLFTLPSI